MKKREDIGSHIAGRLRAINPGGLPTTAGIGWYTRENYPQCLALFDDANSLPATFDDWLAKAEKAEADLRRQGLRVVRVDIDPQTFPAWCKANGFSRLDTRARAQYGSLKAAEQSQTPR